MPKRSATSPAASGGRSKAALPAAEPAEPAEEALDPETVRAFLPVALSSVLTEQIEETGPFSSEGAMLAMLEARVTLAVALFKLSSECSQRVLSHSSRDFGEGQASAVERAYDHALPALRAWVLRLGRALAARSPLPLASTGLPPRFHRLCEVYDLSADERTLLSGLLLLRTSHAFAHVKLGSHVSYGGGGGLYASSSNPAVTLCSILGCPLSSLATLQRPERRHVKQGVVLQGQQLLAEVPALQPEVVLLLLGLPLSESQLFNIEKALPQLRGGVMNRRHHLRYEKTESG